MPKIRKIRRMLIRFSLVCLSLITMGLSAIASDLDLSPQSSSTAAQSNPQANLKTETEVSRLLDAGKQRYANGQFQAAVPFWQQASQASQALGNHLNQALSLSYLSLAYQEMGDWEQAKQAIATCFDLLKTAPHVENM